VEESPGAFRCGWWCRCPPVRVGHTGTLWGRPLKCPKRGVGSDLGGEVAVDVLVESSVAWAGVARPGVGGHEVAALFDVGPFGQAGCPRLHLQRRVDPRDPDLPQRSVTALSQCPPREPKSDTEVLTPGGDRWLWRATQPSRVWSRARSLSAWESRQAGPLRRTSRLLERPLAAGA